MQLHGQLVNIRLLRLGGVWKEGGEDGADEPRGDEEHHQDGGAEHHQGGTEPPHVPRYAQMNHLLDWIEIWIVEIPEEPENPRPEDLSEEDDKGSKVENIDHPNQPVDEH